MYFIRKLSGLVLLFWCAVCWAQVSSPATETDSWIYLDPAQIDSTRFLGPPPDAAATRREIAAMLVMQEQRTPEQARLAALDHEQSVFRFADVMGRKFQRDRLPLTTRLFDTLHETGNAMEKQGKKKWRRVRPPVFDTRIRPVARYSASGSYPSGHATFSFLAAIVLADMVPEKSEQIFTRAREFGEHRVTGGVHYPSDIAAGQRLASLIAVLVQQNPGFQQDYAAARTELRAVLELQ